MHKNIFEKPQHFWLNVLWIDEAKLDLFRFISSMFTGRKN